MELPGKRCTRDTHEFTLGALPLRPPDGPCSMAAFLLALSKAHDLALNKAHVWRRKNAKIWLSTRRMCCISTTRILAPYCLGVLLTTAVRR